MRPMSAGLTNVDERRRRFLFVDFLVRMWLLPARILLIFPFPVLRKRFAAPRLVFIFGIVFSTLKGLATYRTIPADAGGILLSVSSAPLP